MLKIKIKIAFLICFVFSTINLSAQQINTLYFMENVPVRNELNPSFQPLSNFYLGLPVLGNSQFQFGNNALTLKDLIYNDAVGNPITFLHPNGNKTTLYNALYPTNILFTNLQLNLFDIGFRSGKSYWSLSVKERFDFQLGTPKDLYKLILFGTSEVENNTFDLHKLGFQSSLFTEAGLGYSRVLNEKWSVGAKLKLLYGSANISAVNDSLTLNANVDEWSLRGNGSVVTSSPIILDGNSLPNLSPTMPASIIDALKPSGLGAGIDLGLTYKPMKNLTFSASVTDLGIIKWTKNVKKAGYKIDYKYNGLGNFDINSNTDINLYVDTLLTNIQSSYSDSIESTFTFYNTNLSPKLNFGVEYSVFQNKLSFGVLSRTIFENDAPNQEFTVSLNGRPIDWFNMSVSYSILNGSMSNIGAGIGLRTGFLHWFASADYVPLNYIPLPLNQIDATLPIFTALIPYKTKGMNFAFGVNFVFGNRKDTDKDGVVDRKDKCPETPFSVIVDKYGCPLDTDGDGIPDYLDKCAKTPPEAYNRIDQNGCPVDNDGDGVADYLDKCPNTPPEAIGFVDAHGCELDTDKDGVFDYLDKCPNTPEGEKVDSAGCPFDSDGDGVYDKSDLCPETPLRARGMVDKNGCPTDSDGDGVYDYLDLCDSTAIEAKGYVDEKGCPTDKDGDGIPDYLDKCPDVKGTAANNGCEEIKASVIEKSIEKPEPIQTLKSLFQKALQGIQFETGSNLILAHSHKILNQIAGVLIANPTYLVEVRGFTDNVGKPEANKLLSERRAEAVKKYLIQKGVEKSRITANGFGETLPMESNDTAIGRSINRRVEFIVSYEEITFE